VPVAVAAVAARTGAIYVFQRVVAVARVSEALRSLRGHIVMLFHNFFHSLCLMECLYITHNIQKVNTKF
jgi:hypothetical protein